MKSIHAFKNRTSFVMSVPIILLCITLFVSCSNDEKNSAPQTFQQQFTAPIEKAHNADAWKSKASIKTDIQVSFGGNTVAKGTLYVETSSGKTRLETEDGAVAGFDGQEVWVKPNDSAMARADFQVLTWPYFLTVPMKLNDPGTKLSDEGTKTMRNQDYDTAKLTFEAGTGDTPDDWYMLYRHQETNRLSAMAYVVTYGKTLEEANQEPHAITYEAFKTIDGVPIATSWKFWGWSEESGLGEQQIGMGSLSNTSFVKTEAGFYEKPQK